MSLAELVAKTKSVAPLPLPDSGGSPGPAGGDDSASVDSILGAPPVAVDAGRPPATAPVTGEALIATLDGLTPLVVRLCCLRTGVRFTAEITRECRLNEAEKQQLRMTADAAAPLFSKLLEKSEYVAVGVFGISYVMIVDAKIRYIKGMAPPPEKKTDETDPASSAEGSAPAGGTGRRTYVRSGKFEGVAAEKRARRESRK
jgi:hypothetical protein